MSLQPDPTRCAVGRQHSSNPTLATPRGRLSEPRRTSAVPEALLTCRVLDDSVERTFSLTTIFPISVSVVALSTTADGDTRQRKIGRPATGPVRASAGVCR